MLRCAKRLTPNKIDDGQAFPLVGESRDKWRSILHLFYSCLLVNSGDRLAELVISASDLKQANNRILNGVPRSIENEKLGSSESAFPFPTGIHRPQDSILLFQDSRLQISLPSRWNPKRLSIESETPLPHSGV